ncbi:hypothetical protein [Corallococcus sp. EGB]|uniref:hypothetical protein n=1 Tax=Corallococcus sp. EGB TaxID=1521117 RepID=UPI001CBFA8B4|nr:hypothetical protein [Corallococcus sp. EGB]
MFALHRPGDDAEGFKRWLGDLGVPASRLHLMEQPRLAPGEALSSPQAFLRGTPRTYVRFASQGVQDALRRVLAERAPFDIIHFDHLNMAQLLPLARQLNPSAHRIINEHNVESQPNPRGGMASLLEASVLGETRGNPTSMGPGATGALLGNP